MRGAMNAVLEDWGTVRSELKTEREQILKEEDRKTQIIRDAADQKNNAFFQTHSEVILESRRLEDQERSIQRKLEEDSWILDTFQQHVEIRNAYVTGRLPPRPEIEVGEEVANPESESAVALSAQASTDIIVAEQEQSTSSPHAAEPAEETESASGPVSNSIPAVVVLTEDILSSTSTKGKGKEPATDVPQPIGGSSSNQPPVCRVADINMDCNIVQITAKAAAGKGNTPGFYKLRDCHMCDWKPAPWIDSINSCLQHLRNTHELTGEDGTAIKSADVIKILGVRVEDADLKWFADYKFFRVRQLTSQEWNAANKPKIAPATPRNRCSSCTETGAECNGRHPCSTCLLVGKLCRYGWSDFTVRPGKASSAGGNKKRKRDDDEEDPDFVTPSKQSSSLLKT
ncbi:hypothetical protein BP5796_00504 [Coleophoma crateriformis]|uniref:Zn(2)-C6 fungal-type domain-containing protein n=1 Tax=Coleophoma crateriformis TaxID=565419 RepID=A0A3D8T8I3_9HELO|nr:hypothetical protein BP5796_00504 [Coleophoma crateriformis]